MPPRPRDRRDLERARRAAKAAQAQGGTVMAAALAQIEAAFDEAARINAFKRRVALWLRLGPAHPAVRARFAGRAALLAGRSLDDALVAVARWRRDEQQALLIARALGRGSALSLEVLHELRLILRFMRWKRMRGQFSTILAALAEAPIKMAAE